MLSKKKKIVILSGMVVLLVATGFLNVWLNNRDKPVAAIVAEGNFFTTFRADRVNARNQTILYLDSIINNAELSAEQKSEAVSQKAALALAIEVERVLEGGIKALGYSDCVISASTGYVNVIVQIEAANLEASEVAQILHLTMTETGKPATSIRIIPSQTNNSL
ncbi:MAG: SpoIIIAH-like family protein [Clostridiales bacterium]|jgi:stage III sporulation protein AH|nr:SpoIIIAH-like family protein [Clostridiales bacterium]